MSDDFEKARFLSLCARVAPSASLGVAEGWHRVLEGLYAEGPGREYHCRRHVEDLLWRLDVCRAQWEARWPGDSASLGWRFEGVNWAFAELAIWFHDAVYRMDEGRRPGENEEESARLASAFCASLGMPGVGDHCVAPTILLTKHADGDSHGVEADLVLDLDLAGFADPWEFFEGNNRRVRAEHARVDDEAYRWGRLRFLGGLMSRPRIYRVLTKLEEPARANVRRHAADLADAWTLVGGDVVHNEVPQGGAARCGASSAVFGAIDETTCLRCLRFLASR